MFNKNRRTFGIFKGGLSKSVLRKFIIMVNYPTIEQLEKQGVELGRFNVYYTNPKCDSVDYSLRFYALKDQNWLLITKNDEVYPASDFSEEFNEFEERYGYTEEDGFWSNIRE